MLGVAMRVSRKQVAENRRRILEAAGRLFRAKGFEAVTVAEVMRAAGLTHGGFYGHFGSKDDLIAQTLAYALLAGEDRQRSRAEVDLARYAAGYLSPRHRDDLVTIMAKDVKEVRYLDPNRSQNEYGTTANGGAIVVKLLSAKEKKDG